MTTASATTIQELLNKLKKIDFISFGVKRFFPEVKHKLLIERNSFEKELGNCYERIGYFYLSGNIPIIFTCAMISLDKTKKELIDNLIAQRGPFGELLRKHYPNSKIESKTISFEEIVNLPDCFYKIAKERFASQHKRYIIVDGKKIAIAIEYI